MWTPEHRRAAERGGLRYPRDLSDADWPLVAPLIPPSKRGGRPRSMNVREVLNAIFYVLWTGCQWKALPKDFPPKSTVYDYLDLWEWDGTLERLHHALFVQERERQGREASPTLAIIDSQTARGASNGGSRSTRRATMPGRRRRAASATFWSTRSASCYSAYGPPFPFASPPRNTCSSVVFAVSKWAGRVALAPRTARIWVSKSA